MSALRYEDISVYDGEAGYVCPNESVEHWRSLVKGKHIRRAAGISSGGEIGFFALLPTVRDELVLVDHSYASLSYAMQKFLVVKDRGWKEAQRLFSKGSEEEVFAVLSEIRKGLPEKAAQASDPMDYDNQVYDYATGKYIPRDKVSCRISRSVNTKYVPMSKMWADVPKHVGNRITRKLDKITFVHGDYRKLTGPFDLFYLSNAWEAGNGNRSGRGPGVAEIDKLVTPGGYVLVTGREPYRRYSKPYNPRSNVHDLPETWTQLSATVPNDRRNGLTGWRYELYQTGKAA